VNLWWLAVILLVVAAIIGSVIGLASSAWAIRNDARKELE
jgi:uncharacterized protein YneF (UPF0154 family)